MEQKAEKENPGTGSSVQSLHLSLVVVFDIKAHQHTDLGQSFLE